jgi:hypothetical protein
MIAQSFLVLLAFCGSHASPLAGTMRRSLRVDQRRLGDIYDPDDGPVSSPSLRLSSRIDPTVGILPLTSPTEQLQCETAMVYCGLVDGPDRKEWCGQNGLPQRVRHIVII